MSELCRVPELGQQPRWPGVSDTGVSVSLCSAAGCGGSHGEQPKAVELYTPHSERRETVEDPPGEETFFRTEKGDTYRGVVDEKGKPHGKGLWTFGKGGSYEGHFKRNKRHGQGTMSYRDGSRYSGRWEDGQRHGADGLFVPPPLVADFMPSTDDVFGYRGSWRKGKKHGKGVEWKISEDIQYSVRYEKDELKEKTRRERTLWIDHAFGRIPADEESKFKEHSRSSSSVSAPAQPDVQPSYPRSDVQPSCPRSDVHTEEAWGPPCVGTTERVLPAPPAPSLHTPRPAREDVQDEARRGLQQTLQQRHGMENGDTSDLLENIMEWVGYL